VRGWAATVACGLALAVTSYWHSRAGGVWPAVVLAVVLVVVAVVYARAGVER
jgi:hypothetical protein